MTPMIGSIRSFDPASAGQAIPVSAYESAASNWSRLREHLDRAQQAAVEANEEHEKATAAEREAWSVLESAAGRSSPPSCEQLNAAAFIHPHMPRTSR